MVLIHREMDMRPITDIDTETEYAARIFMAKVAGQYDLVGAILFGSRAPAASAKVLLDI